MSTLIRKCQSLPWIRLGLFAVLLATWEVYFTWDSVHYMSLFVNPVNGDTHPLFFGFYLGILNTLGNWIGVEGIGLNFYILIQSLCFLLIIYFVRPESYLNLKNKSLGLLFFLILLPALLIFKIAVWTETIFLLFTCTIAILFESWLKKPAKIDKGNIFGIVMAAVILLNLRYQGAVPVFALILSMILSYWKFKIPFKKVVISILSILLGSMIVSKILTSVYPNKRDAAGMKLNGIQISLKCTLRCQSNAVIGFCADPQQVAQINSVGCSDVLFGFSSLPSVPQKDSLGEVIKLEGYGNMFLWLLKAPWTYFMDRHLKGGLELGPGRLETESASKYYLDAFNIFKYQFNASENEHGLVFSVVSKYLNYLFVESWVINILSLLVLLLSVVLTILKFQPISVFWVLSAVGSLLSFTYFVPHTPFRFLIQIIFLGYMAIKRAI